MFSSLKDQLIIGKSFQPKFSNKKILLSFIGSFVAIFLLGEISIQQDQVLLIAPFGASTVLLFGVSNSPLAQPRNLILGNFLGGISSVVSIKIFGLSFLSCAIAVALALTLGKLFRCLHPPAGAIAVLGVMSNAKMIFVLSPVLTGSFLLLIWGIIFNRIFRINPKYPKHWI